MLTVREILSYNVEENISARVDLEDLAFCALDYTVRGVAGASGWLYIGIQCGTKLPDAHTIMQIQHRGTCSFSCSLVTEKQY